jgi:hypothetical protein
MKALARKFWVVFLIVAIVQLSCNAVRGEPAQPVQPPGQNNPPTQEAASNDPPLAGETLTPVPTRTPTSGEGDTWLIMLYQDADDEVTEGGIFIDLNEAELVGSSEKVKIVSQIDRYQGGFDLDGDWTTTRRYFITQDDDLFSIGSELIEDLGELDSGDWRTLVDFAIWAIETYSADHYVLVMSDHGSAWLGANSDMDPNPDNSQMTMNQIDQALAEIITRTGIGQFDIVGFDACLMGQLEVVSALAPYARYAVISQENEPTLGWAYTEPLAQLSANPKMDAGHLASLFVETYIRGDGMIEYEQGRQVLLRGRNLPLDTSPDELAASYQDITLSAIDLSALPDLHRAVNELLSALERVEQSDVAAARAYAQMYSQIFTEYPKHFMDLGHFTSMLLDIFPDQAGIRQGVAQVQSALGRAVIAEKHGPARPGSTGLSIFFPNSALFADTTGSQSGFPDYASSIGRFAAASLWDDFLRFHYTGVSIHTGGADLTVLNPLVGAPVALATPAPQEPELVTAPGAGQATVAPLTFSAEEIGNEDSVLISTEVQGNHIAYIYLYVFWHDPDSEAVVVMDIEYVDAKTIKEINGVYFPDWGREPFSLEYEWQPTVFYLSNGDEEVFALFEADTYGLGAEDTFYRVSGYYTFARSGQQMYAEMVFNAYGDFDSVWVYSDRDNAAPREVYPEQGDEFTVIEFWLEYDQNPDGELVEYEGGTLVFTDQPMVFIDYTPVGGYYILGIVVEDMDGNFTYEIKPITVYE